MIQPINSWQDLQERYRQFQEGQWCFRGDQWKPGGFKTSLERVAVERWGRDWAELPEIEEGLLRRFKREAHLYLSNEPAEGDRIGWLALMRHHGAPTRLLDWTYSFFVALYFAVERTEPGEKCAVWAMDLGKIWERAFERPRLRPLLAQDPNVKQKETVDAIINAHPPDPLVFRLNPWRMNRRLIVQQSVFLVPGDVTQSFMDNLHAMGDPEELVVEIPLSTERSFLEEATRELFAMNMTSATLFPGLDGFARNLKALIPFPHLRAVDSSIGLE